VHNVVIFVQHLGKVDHELWEAYIEFTHGKQKHRLTRNFRGISETKKQGESSLDTARRLLAEEPGYSNVGFRDLGNYSLTCTGTHTLGPQPSEKWPGLMAKFYREMYLCFITTLIFDPNGYFEKNGNRKTVLLWREI
jgi:hypothetical protein